MEITFQDSRTLKPFIHHQQLTLGSLLLTPGRVTSLILTGSAVTRIYQISNVHCVQSVLDFKHIIIAAHREARHVSAFAGYGENK